jgi:hypothetical protein
VRKVILFVLLCLVLAGCPSTKESPGRVIYSDGGGEADFVLGEKRASLPKEDRLLQKIDAVPVMDDTAKRHAYRVKPDLWRLVYVVGDGVFVGPTTPSPVDFKAAPELDGALGALFEHAGPRRADLVREIGKEKGDAGVARLLSAGAYVDDPVWEEAFAKLPPAAQDDVKKSLSSALDPGKDAATLTRAVRLIPLREPARVPVLSARIRELASKNESQARPVAVLLRALASLDKAEGARVGCEVLKKKPADDVLREATLLAVANTDTSCEGVEEALGKDHCLPLFRCGPDGPLGGREPTKQDEPLCTKEDLAKTIAKDLERKPDDVLASTSGTRGELFAFAILVRENKVPQAMAFAHERRRYAIVQPREPACDAVEAGKGCHCEEAVIRDFACRKASGGVHTSHCKFDVDDAQKKILNVASVQP